MKRPFLTLALLATVAVGGAFAGQSAKSDEEFNIARPASQVVCNQLVPCSIQPGIPCEIDDEQYYGVNPATGACTIALTFD